MNCHLELQKQRRAEHDGFEAVNIPCEEIEKISEPVRQIHIAEGYYGGGCFSIIPVKVKELSSRNEIRHDDNIEIFMEEEISIELDDVDEFLSYFLDKFFDKEFSYIGITRCGAFKDDEFDYYGENIYSYATIKAMIVEIRIFAEMFQNDYDNPALAEVKSRFNLYTFLSEKECWAIRDRDISNNISQQEKNGMIRANIDIANDFYKRFCRRMESMMENAPQYDQISFEGP